MANSDATTTLTIDTLMTHAGWLHRLAAGLLRNGDAEDAAQDALATALRHPPDARGSVRGWFGTVLTNRIRSDTRSEGRRKRTAALAAAEPLETVRTPEDIVAALELQRLVATAVLDLGEPYREVVYLRYFDDLDSGTIAARLGVAPGTVRWRLKTAIDQLRARLDERDGAGGARWRRLLAPLGGAAAATGGSGAAPVVAAASTFSTLTLAAAALALVAVAVGGGALLRRVAAPAGDRPAATASRAAAVATPPAFVAPPAAGSGPEGPGAPPGALAAAVIAPPPGGEPPADPARQEKLAPFTGVRWSGDAPEVEVDGAWWKLRGIDGLGAESIVAFCKEKFSDGEGRLWRKRFSEDLVEVLAGMGKPPGSRVSLELESLKDASRAVISAAMTRDNRQQVWRRNGRTAAPRPERPLVDTFARVSPFGGLRFRGEAIEVSFVRESGRWWRLVSIDRITAETIVASARKSYQQSWRKRVAEDLVEVMTGVGARPGGEVDLVLQDLAAGARTERRRVALTEENRKLVKDSWEQLSR